MLKSKIVLAVLGINLVAIIAIVAAILINTAQQNILEVRVEQVVLVEKVDMTVDSCDTWSEPGSNYHWLSCDAPERGGPDWKWMEEFDGEVHFILPTGEVLISN